jgi:hypothetical protein
MVISLTAYRRYGPSQWLVLLALALTPCLALAQSNPLERQVKAAYLYKFATFIEWPDGVFARGDSPLVIGVAGADALADDLERTVAGRTSNGHPLQVRRLRKGDSVAGLQMLFLSAQDKALAATLLAAARGQPVLTVTEADDGVGLGGMINFLIADERVRFEVALANASTARLRISARMLQAAYRVLPGAS